MSYVLTSHSAFKKKHPVITASQHTSEADAVEAPGDRKGSPNTEISVAEELAKEDNAAPKFEPDEEDNADAIGSSIFEEAIDQAETDPWYNQNTEDGFNLKEALQMREQLRAIGAAKFLESHLGNDSKNVRKLVTAFGVRPDLPIPDSWYIRILGLSIERELRRRQKLPQYNTIDDAVRLVTDSKNIVVITGAGISTSLGIPDFRSKNTGFYSELLARGYESPEEIFDIENFDDDPSIFYSLANEILPVADRCSPTHAFIKLLQDKDKLLTNYTQNIDNIEAFAGILPAKLIQCHGSWATATCRKCGVKRPGDDIFSSVKAQTVARCTKCQKELSQEVSRKRKRTHSAGIKKNLKGQAHDDDEDDSHGEYDIPEAGVMKPDITFFGEQLPNTFFDRLTEHDRKVVDLVIVIGTSMKVAPVSEIPNYIAGAVPQIYISLEPAKHINFDITLLGQCDDVVGEICRRAGWTIEHSRGCGDVPADVKVSEDEGHHWYIRRTDAHEEGETMLPS